MKWEKKYSPYRIIMLVFFLCFIIRSIETFAFRLDETVLNGNVVHKLSGVLILAVVLPILRMTWKEIGFDLRRFIVPTLLGLGLGIARFAIGYGVEYIILLIQGRNPSFTFFLSSFSITGTQVHLPLYCIILACVFNLLNAVMEEGVFRGFFIKLAQKKYGFAIANSVAALLFGIWHIVMPIRSWLDGEITIQTMLFYSVGYMFLSGSIALMWGMLLELSGVIWIGMADHFFNNAIINLLHVSTSSGVDELQIVRAMVAQFLALAFISVLYRKRRKKTTILPDPILAK